MQRKNVTPESQLKATKKYLSKFSDVKIRLTPEEHKTVQEHAAARGESVSAFLKRAISETIERDRKR